MAEAALLAVFTALQHGIVCGALVRFVEKLPFDIELGLVNLARRGRKDRSGCVGCTVHGRRRAMEQITCQLR